MSAARDRNRAAMPAVAEAVDWLRAHLHPEIQVGYARDETTGESVGTPPEAVPDQGRQVPTRNPVQCLGCRHWIPDPINPPAGLGHCALEEGMDARRRHAFFPMEMHHCDQREAADG